jgi:hypothetical protein
LNAQTISPLQGEKFKVKFISEDEQNFFLNLEVCKMFSKFASPLAELTEATPQNLPLKDPAGRVSEPRAVAR